MYHILLIKWWCDVHSFHSRKSPLLVYHNQQGGWKLPLLQLLPEPCLCFAGRSKCTMYHSEGNACNFSRWPSADDCSEQKVYKWRSSCVTIWCQIHSNPHPGAVIWACKVGHRIAQASLHSVEKARVSKGRVYLPSDSTNSVKGWLGCQH